MFPNPAPAKTELGRFVQIVRFCVLASGSSGNSAFLSTSKTRILIDAGLSLKELTRRLAEIGESPEDLDAVLITHEHSDHISGLNTLVRWRERKKKPITVFISKLTAPLLEWGQSKAGSENKPAPSLDLFQSGTGWMVGNIAVQSFTIPHDANDPVGFTFHAEGVKTAVATDLGYIPDSVRMHLRRTQVLLLESNHDLDMLKVGPYPWSIKQRVMGRNGHLSNMVTCDYLENDLDSGVQTLVLGHISEQNNHPAIVRMSAEQSLEKRCMTPKLVIAEQKQSTEVFTF